MLAWKGTSNNKLIQNFALPIAFGLLGAILFVILGFTTYTIISFSLCIFVVVAISSEFIKGVKVRKSKFNETVLLSLYKMIEKNRSRYGGYIVHLGIVLMFVGFTGHAFDKEKNLVSKLDRVRVWQIIISN